MASKIGFLVIGAQKGGTTSLFEYLRSHPQVHMPAEKDVGFFSTERNFHRGWGWYEETVSRGARQHQVCGEASTSYMSGTPFGDLLANEELGHVVPMASDGLEQVIPRRIKKFLPDARIVCVLRDPVTRSRSHHRMMVLEQAESRSFDEAIAHALEHDAILQARIAPTRTNNYVANGEYGRILSGYLSVFPRAQVMAVYSSDLALHPVTTLKALYEFIGVSSEFVPANVGTRYRVAAERERIPGISLARLQSRLSRIGMARSLWHAAPNRFRYRIDRAYTRANYRLAMWNAHRGVGDDSVPAAVESALADHYRPDSQLLGEILGEEVPWLDAWTP